MRKLWRVSVNWDDKIPIDLMLEWNSYEERLEIDERNPYIKR